VSSRRERDPSFDYVEPASGPPSRINGLTDAEWVARRERRERFFRIVCGVAFGGVVGSLSIWHWGFLRLRSETGTLLVVGGSMLLFATLFAQKRDDAALGHAKWILFPEWALAERLPWWAIVAILAACVAVLFTLAALVLVAHLR